MPPAAWPTGVVVRRPIRTKGPHPSSPPQKKIYHFLFAQLFFRYGSVFYGVRHDTMAPQAINLDAHRADLISMYQTGATAIELKEWLEEEHGVSIAVRSIKRRLQTWNVQKTRSWAALIEADGLQPLILDLFFDKGLNDSEILQVLQRRDYPLTQRMLRVVRLRMGLKRRLNDPMERLAAFVAVRQALAQKTAEDSPIIERFGYRLVRTFLQHEKQHYSFEMVRQACRTTFPDAVLRRQYDQQRRRGQYVVPGPNYLWSIDGYDKLKPYGIEIYACIDAYSRYIVWVYVGISNHTQVSVVRQYLETVAARGYIPSMIRSDRGSETPMLANCHWQLHLANSLDTQFRDCYAYGTSTANQRIESWWHQLSKGALFIFRVCPPYDEAAGN
jgi:hypothetical protein